eukprot:scaffold1559_cov114-Cylindrotheca_fusiformis.AAC.1
MTPITLEEKFTLKVYFLRAIRPQDSIQDSIYQPPGFFEAPWKKPSGTFPGSSKRRMSFAAIQDPQIEYS